MGTRKHRKSNKRFRKTRSKRQRGGTLNDDLIWASNNGHIETVARLLENGGTDVNAKNTALMWASESGHKETVATLLENGADVNAKNNNNDWTALMRASWNGHIDTMTTLLEKGADVNAKDDGGGTTLIKASWNGHIDTVRMLLEQPGIDVHMKTNNGWTALRMASENGHPEIVKLIEDYIKNKENKVNTMTSVREHNRPNISSLSTMAYQSVPTYVDTHINLNPGTINRPYGKLGGKRKTRRSKKSKRKTRSKKQGGAKMPYVAPYSENPSGKLYNGVYANNYKMVESAFKEGANVNYKNDNGEWFLMVASENGNARMVNLLLEKGIDVNVTDHYNNTALSIAVRNRKHDVVKLLLEKGADINKANNDDDTPLIHAISFGHVEIVKMLLEHPVIIEPYNDEKYGEIELAEDSGQDEIANLIKKYIETKNQIKNQRKIVMGDLEKYNRPNISSLSTLAYRQVPTDVDTYINLNPGTMNRPYGKLGGKRTRKYHKSKKSKRKGRKTRRK
jgi:ankyrin repeat protein